MKEIVAGLLLFRINVRIFNQTFTQITCNPLKREQALQSRALDFADAHKVFAGLHLTREDVRKDYGEKRFVSFGSIDGVLIVLVWTDRFPAIHVISMRKANRRERKTYEVIHH